MTFEITIPDSLDLPASEVRQYKHFLQRAANRLAQGHARYGSPDERKRYMSRLLAEGKAYKRSGNLEQLYNIANYAFLESFAPENPKAYFDSAAKSVTRKKFGG